MVCRWRLLAECPPILERGGPAEGNSGAQMEGRQPTFRERGLFGQTSRGPTCQMDREISNDPWTRLGFLLGSLTGSSVGYERDCGATSEEARRWEQPGG